MATIRKINVSEVEGRNPNDSEAILPNGVMALYEDNNDIWTLRIHDGVTSGGIKHGSRILFDVPTSSIGTQGNIEGDLAFDSSHIYYCSADYDGTSNVWKRLAWSEDTW
jgi:hypothetical protein